MNCQTCQTELEDLLYGELDAARSAVIKEHLSVCHDCRQAQMALERENEIFAAYYEQNALEPANEMWQAIRARIKDEVTPVATERAGLLEKLRLLFTPLLAPAMLRQVSFAAALVLLSVGLTTLYFARQKEPQQTAVGRISPTPNVVTLATPTPTSPQAEATPRPTERDKPQVAASRVPKVERQPAPPQKLSEEELLTQQIAKASREYQGAIRLLERTIAKRKPELDEGAIKQFEGSLAMIDASIAASKQAMQAHPNDPTAARYLLAAYSKKVELMQEIAMR